VKKWFVVALTGLLMGHAAVRLCAQDPLAVAPDMYKLIHENDRVRILEVTFQPGQKIAPHSHPDHAVYVLEPGVLRIHKPDGSSADADLQVGQVIWIPAETHWAENIGATVVRLLVTELKETAPAPAAP
jgi:quercetin dioxygenase-like cupin family protein